MKWKAIAFEAEVISKDVLGKEFLTEELYLTYRDQVNVLKKRLATLAESGSPNVLSQIEDKFFLIETRLKVLNPTHRIQTNFEFFTRKIYHVKDRLSLLKESLEAFKNGYSNLSTIHCKKQEIKKEIALLEQQLIDAKPTRSSPCLKLIFELILLHYGKELSCLSFLCFYENYRAPT